MMMKIAVMGGIFAFALAMKAAFGQSVETTLLIFVLSFMIGEMEAKK